MGNSTILTDTITKLLCRYCMTGNENTTGHNSLSKNLSLAVFKFTTRYTMPYRITLINLFVQV